jgi:catechol 2,3-dioxygenase-like lactoylglutathione lyase family enzyme
MSSEPLLKTITHVRVFCFPEAWSECAAFYRDVLQLPQVQADSRTRIAVFRLGDGPTFSLETVDHTDSEDSAMVGRFSAVSFRVDDIQFAYETLKSRGVRFDHAPEKMQWGGITAHFRDPASNTLTLVELPA